MILYVGEELYSSVFCNGCGGKALRCETGFAVDVYAPWGHGVELGAGVVNYCVEAGWVEEVRRWSVRRQERERMVSLPWGGGERPVILGGQQADCRGRGRGGWLVEVRG